MSARWIKTEQGQQAFKSCSAQLAGKLCSAYLLFDGKRSVQDVLKATQGLGVGLQDREGLQQAGFLAAPAVTKPATPTAQPKLPHSKSATAMLTPWS